MEHSAESLRQLAPDSFISHSIRKRTITKWRSETKLERERQQVLLSFCNDRSPSCRRSRCYIDSRLCFASTGYMIYVFLPFYVIKIILNNCIGSYSNKIITIIIVIIIQLGLSLMTTTTKIRIKIKRPIVFYNRTANGFVRRTSSEKSERSAVRRFPNAQIIRDF